MIDWRKGTLEWRQPEKPEKETQIAIVMTILEEEDEEEYLNLTQHPLEHSELALLISIITSEMDNNIYGN